jgi:phospholipase C
MMENRSFDHMLGSLQTVMNDVDGVVTPDGAPRTNVADGFTYEQRPGAAGVIKPDPMHELDNVDNQLEGQNAGFVADYAFKYRKTSRSQRQEIMAYHDVGSLPAFHDLAQHFTVCDRWFSSVPGPTWPNRLFALSGTSLGRVHMPSSIINLNLHRYEQDTIFDRLREAGRSWRIYFGDFPLALLFEHERRPSAVDHYSDFDDFADDVDDGDLPDFTFIEPRYLWPGTDDDHPPHEIADGQRLIAKTYNVLRASALWPSTLLVILYDEHGGFYDHVVPSSAVPPDEHHEEFAFDRYGVRVPALLVSPWVDRAMCHDTFDHTSLLRYLTDLWSLGPLGKRTAQANSIAPAIRSTGAPRVDTPKSVSAGIPRPRAMARRIEPPPERLNELQQSIIAFSQVLEKETPDAPARRVARNMALMEGPEAQSVVAEERARRFLRLRAKKPKGRPRKARKGKA